MDKVGSHYLFISSNLKFALIVVASVVAVAFVVAAVVFTLGAFWESNLFYIASVYLANEKKRFLEINSLSAVNQCLIRGRYTFHLL